jgi:hypothetical protein
MHDEHLSVIELCQQIFRAPLERLDLAAREPLPTRMGSKPLRTVSTSGSSAMIAQYVALYAAMRNKLRCSATIA